ncbi:hypothetical protein TWF694_002914 [Orbilia ellipsospora]|uniref:FAD-binding PCMH-type domain-containing protein n=1 Tax=Orbilia ellipsospora TaxID=2528407 RepID=A0AAV9X2D7_9PEZI
MVRLSTVAFGLLASLANGVAAQSSTTSAPVDDSGLSGSVLVGFPTVNVTAMIAKAENQLGVNGTVTDNLPADYSTPGTVVKARDLDFLKLMKRDSLNSILAEIACLALQIAFGSKLAQQGTGNYNSWNNPSFWSATTYMTPTCVFKPANANDVSLAIRIIVLCQSQFNVVGGGHSAIKGWANVEDGVLFVMSGMTGVTVVPPSGNNVGVAQVPAGERWGSTFTQLDAKNLMALGGRMSTVGVPGLTLGGGISYLSNQWGFVTDQVQNFEVVLSNGLIVNANKNTNSDLFKALKGGSSNFGIVTRFDLRTWPSNGIYSGQFMFTNQNDFPALYDFTYRYHSSLALTDVTTHVISAFVYVAGFGHIGAFTAFRNIATATPGPSLQPLLDINPSVTSQAGLAVRPYGQQCILLGSGDVTGLRQDMRDFSAYISASMYKDMWNIWNTNVASKFSTVAGFQGTIAFQPITTTNIAAGKAAGGNSLGLDNNTGTMAIINLTHQWSNSANDAAILAALDSTLALLVSYAKSKGIYHPYYYLNYARKQDNPIGSYGSASVSAMRTVSRKYDPLGVFQDLVPGGFKIPS